MDEIDTDEKIKVSDQMLGDWMLESAVISYDQQKMVLTSTANNHELEKIAEALLEYETIEGKHVQEIVEFGEIRSEVISTKTEELKNEEKKSEEAVSEEAIGENEELPPAVGGAQAIA